MPADPPRQRTRTTIACTTCRTKRIRCNGTRPSCGACVDASRTCEYPFGEEKRKPPSKKYVQALLARIDVLEAELAIYKPKGSLQKQQQQQQQAAAVASRAGPQDSISPTPSSAKSDPKDDLSDLLGQLSVGGDGQITYLGPRSNFFANDHSDTDSSDTQQKKKEVRAASVEPRMPTGISDELMDELLDLYWAWQHPWMYFVHKKLFLEEFSQPGGNYCTSLLLFSVLALASRYSDNPVFRSDPNDPNTAGDYFSEQARLLLSNGIENPTASTVAAALHIAVRQMAVDKEPLGWAYAGIASRISFNLGLHLDCSYLVSNRRISETDAEVRNITWWGNYHLDKLMNVGLGRPGTTAERDILALLPNRLPEVEYAPWLPFPNDHHLPSQTSYCVSSVHHTCKMFLISSDSLDEINAPNSRLSRQEKIDLVTQTYMKLATFYNNLPSAIRLPQSSKKPMPPHIYMMHIQYFTAVIQLHRPFIRRLSTDPFSDLLQNSDYTHNAACTSSAESISSIIRTYRSHYTLRRIPISVIHSVGTSSVIHLFNATSSDPIERRKAIRLLRLNFNAMQEMKVAWNAWSTRTIHTLQLLAKKWVVSEVYTDQSLSESMQSAKASPKMQQGLAVCGDQRQMGGTAAKGGPSGDVTPTLAGPVQGPSWVGMPVALESPTGPEDMDMDWLFSFETTNIDWSNEVLQPGGLDYSLWNFESTG